MLPGSEAYDACANVEGAEAWSACATNAFEAHHVGAAEIALAAGFAVAVLLICGFLIYRAVTRFVNA